MIRLEKLDKNGKPKNTDLKIIEVKEEGLCKHCKGVHKIYKCTKKAEYTIGKIGKIKIDEDCYYCPVTKSVYMTMQDIDNNRLKYGKALNKEIEALEADGNLYSVFRHYSLTNRSIYTNSIQIGITTDYDEAIRMIVEDKNLFLKYATKELNEIDESHRQYYTGGKAPKRFTYSISIGNSFIAK